MPVSVHTDDNPSPRTELLSPTSESTTSLQQPRSSVRSSSSSTSPRDRRNGDHRRQRQHRTNGKDNTSKNWWRDRERELLQSNFSPRDLIRMVIEAEKETTKLHDTLSNTVTMLDEESRKCASLERDTVSTFTRLNSARERAQAHADAVAQDLRVAQFELEHAGREIERLKEELEVQKQLREEGEAQLTRVKNAAHKLRQERMVDLAREEGRRQGFEAGFMRAQAESAMKMQATTSGTIVPGRRRRDSEPVASTSQPPPRREISRIAPSTDQVPQVHRRPEAPEDQESVYEELSSIPIITPPQGMNPIPNTHKIPMRTGYSPTRRPARTRTKSPTPSVDHYPVSIPPQEIIEQIQNINPINANTPREEWVTGEQHRDIHGQAPSPSPITPIFNPNSAGPAPGLAGPPTSIMQTSVTPSPAGKHRVKFRRPTLAKTKQTATSWYRSLSFRKKQKQKIVIDPTADEEEGEQTEVQDENAVYPTNEAGPSGTGAPERTQSFPTQTSQPPSIAAPPPSRHSKAASMSSTIRARDYAFPFKGQGHRPRAGSVDSLSTHTSQFDMLTAPSVSMGGYSKSGPANTSVASLGSMAGAGKAPSMSGRSAKSTAISKKLSMIRENPASREPTPSRPSHNQAPGQQAPPASRFMENDMRSMRSMKSGKSTNSRMVVLNPDPESPDWARQASQPRTQIYANPPSGSALMQPAMSNPSLIYDGLVVVPPLRTKKSGQTIGSLGGSQIGLDTPTPMPKSKDKGKGKEIVPPMIGGDRGASGSGHGTSPGIGISIQTPSDRARQTSGADHQDGDFLSPRQSSRTYLQHSTPHYSASAATSTTRVPDLGSPQGFPSSMSPIRGSSPKIFLAQGLPDLGNGQVPKQPFITVLGANTSNAGMTPGPMLSQLLPTRTHPQTQHVAAVPVPAELGAELHQTTLHRAGSSSSLRSQGSFGKFDPTTYQDPALWAVPPGPSEGRPVSRASSRRISYADM